MTKNIKLSIHGLTYILNKILLAFGFLSLLALVTAASPPPIIDLDPLQDRLAPLIPRCEKLGQDKVAAPFKLKETKNNWWCELQASIQKDESSLTAGNQLSN